MENSIEEDIKILEEFKTNGYSILLMKYGDRIKTNFKLAKAIEHIVSDYKKVLKENEILKEEKEQAWEEWNNLEQGSYGTEQKLKQQIKELKKENEELKFEERRRIIGKYGDAEIHDIINRTLSNDYIPVQIIEDFIKKYQKLSDEFYEKFLETNRTDKDLHDVGLACDAKVQVLQELREGGQS